MRYFFLGFVLTLSALTAFAQSYCQPDENVYILVSKVYKSGDAYCSAWVAANPDYAQYSPTWKASSDGGGCVNKYGYYFVTVRPAPYCSSGGFPNNQGLCECNTCASKAGLYDNAGDPQIVQLPGPAGIYTGKLVDGKVPAEICLSGCSANPRAGYDYVAAAMKDGTYSIQGNPKYTGSTCGDRLKTPDYTPMPKNSPEYDCVAKGQNFGYVNGVVTCTSKTTPTEANGKTTTTTKDNGDGTKLETKTSQSISCSGAGSCVTTTTTTTTIINSDGSRGASVTRTDGLVTQGPVSGSGTSSGPQVDKSDPFCVSNPNSPMCKSGSFSGSCDAQPACEGDPVQCAVAIATWKTDCKTLKPGTPPTDTPPVTEKKIGNQFSASDIGSGGGSCPNPRVLSIAGQSISVEFTPICDFASAIRPVVILLGWICAGYIVLGRSGGARNG